MINALERAVLLSTGPAVERSDLPVQVKSAPRTATFTADDASIDIELPPDGVSLDRVERALIEQTLKQTRGNVSRAAEMLRISRGALRNKLSRHKINPHAFRGRVLVGVLKHAQPST